MSHSYTDIAHPQRQGFNITFEAHWEGVTEQNLSSPLLSPPDPLRLVCCGRINLGANQEEKAAHKEPVQAPGQLFTTSLFYCNPFKYHRAQGTQLPALLYRWRRGNRACGHPSLSPLQSLRQRCNIHPLLLTPFLAFPTAFSISKVTHSSWDNNRNVALPFAALFTPLFQGCVSASKQLLGSCPWQG